MIRKFLMTMNMVIIILAALAIVGEARSIWPLIWLLTAVLNGVAFGIQWFLHDTKKEANRAT